MGECSEAQNHRKFWQKLWKMNVPNRVKVFAWRACRNGLPTLLNLKTRKVVEEVACRWCKEEEEDITHALLSCKTVREVWYDQLPDLIAEVLNMQYKCVKSCNEGAVQRK